MNTNMSLLEALLNMLQKKMIDPESNYYLPKLMQQLSDPSFNPYVVNGSWNINGLSGYYVLAAANTVCFNSTPDKYHPVSGRSSDFPTITLSSISITGLINVLPEVPTVIEPSSDAPKVTVLLDFCTVTTPSLPQQISVTGNFTLSQNCCIPDKATCNISSPKYNTSGDGTFTATLTPSESVKLQMTCNSVITVQHDGKFLVTINNIDVNIPNEALEITVKIVSSGKGDKSDYEKLAHIALNDPGAKTQILNHMQSEVSSDTVRNEIGNMITQKLNSIF